MVPSTWRDVECGVSISIPSSSTPYRTGDFLIGRPDPVHGEHPFTHQSGGCGQPGDFISIPHTFIMHRNITEEDAATFVHQWSKYRYGVFDEDGFSGDKLYPRYYVPTLEDGEECDPQETSQCFFVPDGSSAGMGYSNRTRRTLAPTKQAVLCQGRSAMDVILSHQDFYDLPEKTRQTGDIAPQLTIVREPSAKYVLAIETSALMSEGETWRWIEKATNKFIRFDVPGNSLVSILTFAGTGQTDTVSIEHPLVQVTSDAVRSQLADTIPGKYHLSTEQQTCATRAVQTAVEEVLQGNTAGAHIILVSSGDKNCLTAEDQKMIVKYVNMNNLKLSTISISEMHHLQFYDHISQISGGRSFHIPKTGYELDMLQNLNFAFSQILLDDNILPTELPVTVHKADVYNGELSTSEGSFVIDETLGRDTVLGVYVEDEEDHLIKSIQLTDSDGNKYGPFTKMSSTFDLVNLKTINYVGRAPPFGDVSI